MSAAAFRPQRQPLVAAGTIEHHVADLTVTAAADVTLASLQQKLAEHDQWLPIDGDPHHTLGELVEQNSTGPLRLGFGAWRDLLLGMQLTTPAKRFITAGAATMKNVAGYDIVKFMVGSRGRFGKIATITTRTYKRPAAALLVSRGLEVVGRKLENPTHDARPTTHDLQWMMLADGVLWCGYLGDERSIEFHQGNHSNGKRQSLQEDIDFRAARWLGAGRNFRASVPPTKILQFVRQSQINDWSADAAFGIVVGSCESSEKDFLRKAADGVGGSVFFADDPPFPKNVAALVDRVQSAFNA
ncbi:MAG TPA: FAD-binding oxidoreductase [Tepidisphaeraceae bacterium]